MGLLTLLTQMNHTFTESIKIIEEMAQVITNGQMEMYI